MKTTFSQLPQFGSSKFKQAGLPSLDAPPAKRDFNLDTWDVIFENIESGIYSEVYSVGDTKTISYDGSDIEIQIAGFDKDELSDGSGFAPITLILVHPVDFYYVNGTYKDVNWSSCDIRRNLIRNYFPKLPQVLKDNIKTVKKSYYKHTGAETLTIDDTIWLLSSRELNYPNMKETTGCIYDDLFKEASDRIRTDGTTDITWWTRTNWSKNYFARTNANGTVGQTPVNNSNYILFGFCI